MKFSSLQENLKQGIFTVSHIAGKNSSLPILNNILIDATQGNIKLISTNLEIGVSCIIRGKIDGEGSFTVDSKIISDYISLLPNKKINIETVGNEEVVVDCDNYKTKIKGQSSDDYPLIPSVGRSDGFKVSVSDFKKAISQVVFASSTNESRIELSGVLFSFNEKELVMVSTDSYRLAEKRIKLNQSSNMTVDVIVPNKTVQEVYRILSGSKEDVGVESGEVEIFVLDNQILFVYGNTEIISRVIEGQYPDYKQIIPTIHKTQAIIEVNQLVKAVKAAALFSKTGINDINLDFPKDKKQIIISSTSGQTGENITELEAETSGDDNGVVVNFRYLLDGLNNLNSTTVRIDLVDGNTPCIIRPESEEDYLYIVMPIKQ